MGSQRESVCGTDREGAEWGGMAPTEGASVVLKERQKVIITIARQVGGVQVREELVRICEFWKESFLHGVAEGFLEGGHVVGHVWGVR